jgi:hypothetical protein
VEQGFDGLQMPKHRPEDSDSSLADGGVTRWPSGIGEACLGIQAQPGKLSRWCVTHERLNSKFFLKHFLLVYSEPLKLLGDRLESTRIESCPTLFVNQGISEHIKFLVHRHRRSDRGIIGAIAPSRSSRLINDRLGVYSVFIELCYFNL